MITTREQWPHTIADIVKSLDGTWGLVGATSVKGNLLRLERSLNEPTSYTLTEYKGEDESQVLRTKEYGADRKQEAIADFAKELGFGDN